MVVREVNLFITRVLLFAFSEDLRDLRKSVIVVEGTHFDKFILVNI